MAEAPRVARCRCGAKASRDFKAEGAQIGAIEGETSGFYGKAFPTDPKNPAQSIVPNRAAWREHCRRNGMTDMS